MDTIKTILRMKGISKDFPGVKALNNVDFIVNYGEIHGLIGQNGAGKSTLVKILAGDLTYNQGVIEIDGKATKISNARDAINCGISIVYQDLSLLTNLTVAENISLGREDSRIGIIDNKLVIKKIKDFLNLLEIDEFKPEDYIEDLDISQRQLVEIVKALSYRSKILILDEPTSALTIEESKRLFEIISKLKKEGIAVIYISHKLKEILEICDRGTILKDGKVVDVIDISRTDENKIVELMIGQSQEKFYYHRNQVKESKEEIILDVKELSLEKKFTDVSFKLKKGEIIGITGVLGSGIYELGKALFGAQRLVKGKIIINNKNITLRNPTEAIRNGLGILSEDRKTEGLFLDLSVMENISLPSLDKFRYPFIRLLKINTEKREVYDISNKVNVVMHSLKQRIKTLSGGNQQKAIISRWLLRNLDILVFIEPTVGIDVGAKREIYKLLIELSNNGKSIIIISIDYKEILEISDRIFIMQNGKLSKPLKSKLTSEDELLQLVHMKGKIDE